MFRSHDRRSRALHGVRKWMVRNLRIAIPLYAGRWGVFAYPHPKGFPRKIPQNIVFGDPLVTERARAHSYILSKQVRVLQFRHARFSRGCYMDGLYATENNFGC